MIQKFFKLNNSSTGFTLIEMLVVVAIIGSLTGLFLLNYAGLRGPRNLKIAQNELITNFRKIQSYTLSARDVNSTNAARYYIMKLTHTGTSYNIQAIGVNKTTAVDTYFDGSSVAQPFIENIKLPQGISISGLKVTNKAGLTVMDTNGVAPTSPQQCVQVGFSSPFAKVYIEYRPSGDCNFYTVVDDPDVIANHALYITLNDSASGRTSTTVVRGVTGIIEAQ